MQINILCAVILLFPATYGSLSSAESVFSGPPVMLQESGAGEGPTWHAELGLLTSSLGNIHRRDRAGQQTIYRKDAGSNGLLFDRSGNLVICASKARAMHLLNKDGKLIVLTESYEGNKYNNPNDVTIDSKNRIYFTDPRYGDRTNMEMLDESGKAIEGVYRIDTEGGVARIITHEVDRPNGIMVTPDDKFLFVADNNNDEGGVRKLWRFDLQEDGTVNHSSQKLIYDWGTTRGPDGMKLDSDGRLYVAAGLNKPNLPKETADKPTAGIYVFTPAGKFLEFVNIPRDETTNCAFGGDDGKTLFVTAGGTLWAIPTKTAGYKLR